MLRNDYILRIIEEFTKALRRVAKRREDKEYAEAARELDEFVQSLVGMDLKTLGSMNVRALEACAPEPERSAMLARALKEQGELVELSQDRSEALTFYKKAFLLYDGLEERGALPAQGEHLATLDWLVAKLG